MCCMQDRHVKECLEFIILLELVPLSYIEPYMINTFLKKNPIISWIAIAR